MRFFDNAVERFCYKHPKFGIPRLIFYVIIGTALAYIVSWLDTTGTFLSYLCFDPEKIFRGEVWRVITFLFIPTYSSLLSTVLSLYFYYFIGTALEAHWGSGRFTIYYLMGVLLSVIYGFVAFFLGADVKYEMSSHYINLALFFAFATLWPEEVFMIFFILPVKAKWLALLDAAFFVLEMVLTRSLFPLVLILNYLLFFAYVLIERIAGAGKTARRRRDFNTKVHLASGAQRSKGYRHRCEVCGRTDVTNPELDFRYCSRCQGYHCFCMEHINNHVHFTE